MSRRSRRSGKEEKLDLTYRTGAPRPDIEEIYSEMFEGRGAVVPFPSKGLQKTSPDVLSPDVLTSRSALNPGIDKTSPDKTSGDVLLNPSSSPASSAPVDQELQAVVAEMLAPKRLVRPYQLHRCVLAQDGHSASEEALYQVLWRAGRQVRSDDPFRLAQIAQNELAARVRITTRNLRPALERLEEKLSIEELHRFDRGTKTARIWKVYSYKAILDRRKAAGMEWIVRDKGVRFVNPSQYKTSPDKTSGDVLLASDITSGDKTSVTSPDKTSPHTLLGLSIREAGGQTTSTAAPPPAVSSHPPAAPRAIVEAFLEIAGHADDQAARRLVEDCRAKAPDATEEEIVDRMRHQGSRIAEINHRADCAGKPGSRISNRAGFLISEVPKCFEPQSLVAFRQARNRQLEVALREKQDRRRAHLEMIQEQHRILSDPQAMGFDREMARMVLERDEEQRRILADPQSSAEEIQRAREYLCED